MWVSSLKIKFLSISADVFLMSASLAVVAVGNPFPVWLGREAVVLTPVRLPYGHGLPVGSDWENIDSDSGRGDAVVGRYASNAVAGDLANASSFGFSCMNDSLIVNYIWQAGTGNNGRFVNYYA